MSKNAFPQLKHVVADTRRVEGWDIAEKGENKNVVVAFGTLKNVWREHFENKNRIQYVSNKTVTLI